MMNFKPLTPAFLTVNILFGVTYSTVSAADVQNVRVYRYDNQHNGQLPFEISKYYQANTTVNPLQLSLDDMVSMSTWTDANGDNYLLQFKQPNADNMSNYETNRLLSHLYTINAKESRRLWQVYDFQEHCGLDVIAKYADNSPVISDVNNNGIAEVAIAYYLGCRGGVDYDDMKVIMYEGTQKFAVRGHSAFCSRSTQAPNIEMNDHGGDYVIDESLFRQSNLTSADKELFRQQLRSAWQQTQCTMYTD